MSPQFVFRVSDFVVGFAVAAGCLTFTGTFPLAVAVLHPGTVTGRSAAREGSAVNEVVAISAKATVTTFAVLNIIEFLFPFNRSRRLTSDI
jgi:hypothetical protein